MSALPAPSLVGHQRRADAVACAAGAVVGLAYTLSPVSAWFLAAMVLLFVWAGRGVTGRERKWLFGLMTLAVVLRLLALVVFFLVTYRVDGSFAGFIPDEPYIARRALFLRNIALSIPMMRADYI